ncbi:hypothetical protein [Actinoplanes sp. NPDC051494]|uniref:hypothetical protein n=1 Tax=Actinoplanes sp. NPDC051494 TaxID=3363907 RepID=UPI00378E255D
MSNYVAEIFLNQPAPAMIWGMLWVLTLPALVVLAGPDGPGHPWRAFRHTVGAIHRMCTERRRRRAEAAATVRWAGELDVAARRAERAAELWQTRWTDTEAAVETGWQAWQDAQDRLDRVLTATAFRKPFSVPTPTEYAGRERYLHRAVSAAADRGDLPVSAVADAYAGRGWDARLDPFDQELAVLRAAVAHRGAGYRRAVAEEQRAWHDLHLARTVRADLHTQRATAATTTTAAWKVLDATATRIRPARTALRVRTA